MIVVGWDVDVVNDDVTGGGGERSAKMAMMTDDVPTGEAWSRK